MQNKEIPNLTISVVMATYNGGEYLQQQLDSIVPYLKANDELIISDDGSNDNTIEIIRDYKKRNSNILFINGPCAGVIKNFENALCYAKNDIIMFADQDDVWLPTKLEIIRDVFLEKKEVELVLHNMYMCSNIQIQNKDYGISDFIIRKRRHGFIYNLIYSGYYGCCMSIRKEFKEMLLPFPDSVNMYDQWIGLISESRGSSIFLDAPLVLHRIHGSNMTRHLSIVESLRYKSQLLMSFVEFKKRKK